MENNKSPYKEIGEDARHHLPKKIKFDHDAFPSFKEIRATKLGHSFWFDKRNGQGNGKGELATCRSCGMPSFAVEGVRCKGRKKNVSF